jgi:hypothetical protein
MTMRHVDGVDMVVQHEAAFGVVHDFWVPSMTASIPLGWQYKRHRRIGLPAQA